MDTLTEFALKSQNVLSGVYLLLFIFSWPAVIGELKNYNDIQTFNCVPKPSDFTRQRCYDKYTSAMSPLLTPLDVVGITYGLLGFFWAFFILTGALILRQIKREKKLKPRGSSRLEKKKTKFLLTFFCHLFSQLAVLGVMMGLFCGYQSFRFPAEYMCSQTNTTLTTFNKVAVNLTCNDVRYKEKTKLNIVIIVIMAISIALCLLTITHLAVVKEAFLNQLPGYMENVIGAEESNSRNGSLMESSTEANDVQTDDGLKESSTDANDEQTTDLQSVQKESSTSKRKEELPCSVAQDDKHGAVRPGHHPGTDEVYNMTACPRGITLIINNYLFYGHPKHDIQSTRHGSEEDVRQVKALFDALGFEVHAKENLTRLQLLNELDSVACQDHSGYDCFVLWLMSHGMSGVVLCSDGKTLPIQSAQDMLSNCKTLRGKPKLFFIPASRGDASPIQDPPGHVDPPSGEYNPSASRITPTHADFLYSYATVDGYVSYRHKALGSYYVRALVDVFRDRATYDDLLGILTTVNRKVSEMVMTMQALGRKSDVKSFKQMPEVKHTLRKRLRF